MLKKENEIEIKEEEELTGEYHQSRMEGRWGDEEEEEREAFCVSKNFWWVSTAIQQLPPLLRQLLPPNKVDFLEGSYILRNCFFLVFLLGSLLNDPLLISLILDYFLGEALSLLAETGESSWVPEAEISRIFEIQFDWRCRQPDSRD